MKKKFMLALLVFILMVGLNPQSITKAQDLSTQGDQYEQGKYDLQAEFPFGSNWNRNSPYTGTEVNQVKWEYVHQANDYTLHQFRSQPAIGRDGTIYATNQDHKLVALNPDGSVKWITENIAGLQPSPVIAEDGTIYVGSEYGLTALNPEDGSIKWQVKGISIHETPIIGDDGTIYVHNFGANQLEAYNPDGSIKWKSNKVAYGKNGSSSMLLSKDGTIYTLINTQLYAHDKNGNQIWVKSVGSDYNHGHGFALGLNGEILVTDRNNVYVLDKDGNLLHQLSPGSPSYIPYSAPTVSTIDGTIYISGGRYLYAYNPDYTLKWKYEVKDGRSVYNAPVIDKNGVIYIKTKSDIIALNPDGTVKWSLKAEPGKSFHEGDYNNSLTIGEDGTLYTGGSVSEPIPGQTTSKTYGTIIAIGDPYEDKFCTKESTYMEVLKTLESKSKTANLTEEEKQEARNILQKLTDDLDNPEQ